MKIRPSARKTKWRGSLPVACFFVLVAGCFFGPAAPAALGQDTGTNGATGGGALVDTLGGGPKQGRRSSSGSANGNTFLSSQFNDPYAAAVDNKGNLYIADRGNGQIRKITKPGATNSITSALISGLSKPVDVAVGKDNNLYVLTQGDGTIRKYKTSGSLKQEITSGLDNPTALALDSQRNIYVAELGGTVRRILAASGDFDDFLVSGLNHPRGIALIDDNTLAVSDSDNNQIQVFDLLNQANNFSIGDGSAGFADGLVAVSKFNHPQKIAASPNGSLVVADRLNNRVRTVDFSGTVTTLYGTDKGNWNQAFFPGWSDGFGTNAASRDPVGVTVTSDGTVYTTEIFYDLVRQVTGTGLSSGGGPVVPGGPTNVVVVTPPKITPTSGFFPGGQQIRVISPADCLSFYTLDGSEPTTNSFQVPSNGFIFFNNGLSDLTALRVKTFCGTNASVTVSGQPATANDIGVPTDINGGSGATVLVPVVVNLQPNQTLKSIQFRVEVRPDGGSAPPISDQFRALSLTTNDFVFVAGPGAADTTVHFTAAPYSFGNTRGLVITAIEVDSKFSVNRFAVVALLAVPIPPTANVGDRYSIEVIAPSGTSDGRQASVPLAPMTARAIQVANIPYLVGDSSPARWYNAGDFGDGLLNNDDVNTAFFASLGIRVPPSFTDVFDAMDAYPDDGPGAVGGDGQIRFLDWQRVLQRSLGLDPNNWVRSWAPGGVRVSQRLGGGTVAAFPQPPPPAPANDWVRQALLSAGTVEQVAASHDALVPVSVKVGAGYSLAGLNFRATVTPVAGAPAIVEQVSFSPAPGIPDPVQGLGPDVNGVLCGWPLVPAPSFKPSLQGTVLLGYIRVPVPATAVRGHAYRVSFSNADGSPDINTQYDFETLSGYIWVSGLAQAASDVIPGEWTAHYFASADDATAGINADPDGDRVSNLREYLEGTNPLDARSVLSLAADDTAQGVVLRWLTAPGKLYALDGASDIGNPHWQTLASALIGDGLMREFLDTDESPLTRFYRLRVMP